VSDAGLRFDDVAEEYDRVRPTYPGELVDEACALLGLEPGSRVLEVGGGTGKLTRELVLRGLDVEVVEPGREMIRVARRNLGDAPVRFHVGRFEELEPYGVYDAIFAAAAWHWVDPAVGWAKAARQLRAGGGLALLMHAAAPLPGLLAAWRAVVPEAAAWRRYGDDDLWAGALERRHDVSEVWSWLGDVPLARPEAAELFGPVELRQVPVPYEVTAAELLASMRTQSTYLALDAERRERLDALVADAIGERASGTSLALLAVAKTRPN
jgi:SAM-dependent methyltransferase